MNRRKFILFNCVWSILPSAAAGQSIRSLPAVTTEGASDAYRTIAREIAALFTDLEAARVVGREYLRQNPASADAESLIAGIALTVSPCGGADFRARVENRRSAEFLSGRTVVVNNWILPRIEADLCALTVLLPAGV